MNWKDKLTEKFNLTKGGKDVSIAQSNSSISSRGNNRRSSNTRLHGINKKELTTNDERRIRMISAEHTFDDYDAIVKEDISADVKLVKIQKIIIKLLLSIRTNQVGGVRKDHRRPEVNAKSEVKVGSK